MRISSKTCLVFYYFNFIIVVTIIAYDKLTTELLVIFRVDKTQQIWELTEIAINEQMVK